MSQLAAFPKERLATDSRHITLSLNTCLQWRPSQPSGHAFLKNEYVIIALAYLPRKVVRLRIFSEMRIEFYCDDY